MPPINAFELGMVRRLAALELFLITLVRETPALHGPIAEFRKRHPGIPLEYSAAETPEVSDLLRSEFQEAWEDLLQRMLPP
jgi:hypothetical protein